MADMRHRDGKLKTMHTIIGDFSRTLKQIATLEEVESILTGTISPSKSYQESLTFQYFTDNGLKLLAKTTTAVQEIFIVTQQPDLLLDELYKAGFVEHERTDVRHAHPHRRKRSGRQQSSERPAAKSPETRSGQSGQSGHDQNSTSGHSDRSQKSQEGTAGAQTDPLTLRQMLDPATVAGLMKMKEQATPKPRETAADNQERVGAPSRGEGRKGNAAESVATRSAHSRDGAKKHTDNEEDFASLFAPEDDSESFEELLNKSKLDPKFFK